jgi:hypothetical protein
VIQDSSIATASILFRISTDEEIQMDNCGLILAKMQHIILIK